MGGNESLDLIVLSDDRKMLLLIGLNFKSAFMLPNLVIQRDAAQFQIWEQTHDFGWSKHRQPITKVLGIA